MDYALAKQLKEAGFPQTHPESKWSEFIYPTLEELIAACEGELVGLQYLDESWCAYRRGYLDGVTGSTLTEAVARLWLALKK